jgi:dihydropteroate synthase
MNTLMRFGSHTLDLSRPSVMGVLNVTPDSFYDGGRYYRAGRVSIDHVLHRAEQMVTDGAAFLDVGGESTRPGALSVSEGEECDRVLPVVEALVQRFSVIVSIDTSSPVVIREAARLGAGLINDVRSLRVEGALTAAVEAGLPVCLMHMLGDPATMQAHPKYDDPVEQIYNFLAERRKVCLSAGLTADQIIVDPGIGFGKVDEHNLALIKNLKRLSPLGAVLLGVSRKSLFGRLLGREPADRLAGGLAVAMVACQNGASIIRTHDVAETVDVIKMYEFVGRPLDSLA